MDLARTKKPLLQFFNNADDIDRFGIDFAVKTTIKVHIMMMVMLSRDDSIPSLLS